MFNRHAVEAVEAERALHESFFGDLGLSEEQVAATPMAPTNLAYTSFLLASVHGASLAEGLGALLPCYWIYWEVGKELAGRGSAEPLYQRWIDAYASEDFAGVVRDVVELMDATGERLDGPERARVAERFVTASRYEWMFWDMAWRREAWPVG
jgi:thiaminase (transcriptional activator TenA)